MKKLFTLTIMALVLMMTNLAWGQTRTTVTDQLTRESTGVTGSNYTSWSGVTSNSDAVYAGQSAGGNESIQLRSSNNNSGIITTTSGGTVTNVTVTWNASTANGRTLNVYGKDSAYESPADLYNSNNQGTLIGTIVCGTSTSLDISDSYAYIGMRSANSAMYLSEIDITWSTGSVTPTVALPTFTPAAGTYYEAQNVTIGCATEGATIYYTLDGTDPTTESTVYSTPIAITETTTVKALGVKEGMNNSNIVTATYTIAEAPTPITIAEARALANNEYALVQGIVTFIDGRNVYVQDATAGIDLYLNSGTVPSALAIGDMVLAYGQKTVYNGLIELKNINGGDASQFSIVSTGNELPAPVVKTIGEILTDEAGNKDLQSSRVQIVGATIGAINLNGNTAITQDEQSVNIYKIPAVEGLLENDIVTVTSVVARYNGNLQLRVAFAADVTFEHPVVQTVATPTFDPAAGTYYETQNVTIACTTEGATIYYTLDGTNPTTESTEYTAPIEVVATTTVKAFAVKEGLIDSDIATALYTIEEPATPTDYTLITHNVALVPGDKYIIVGIKSDTLFKAMGKQNDNNRPAVAVTPVENVISIVPATTVDEGVFELTLGQDSVGYWTLYDAVNGGYLYAASSSSNHLKTQPTNDANGQWTINIADNGVATIKAQGENTRNWLRLNNNGSPFSCYGSGQLDVYLYKAGDIPQPTYYTVSVAEGITNGTVTVNPESATEGATITVTATPASGYELATLTYTYGETTNNIDPTTMQFVMPAANVTVNATFAEMASVATPTFTPAAGTYITTQYVTIACETEGATIYYTLDGTDPTTESTVYTDTITINATTTVKAFAVKEGLNNSAIASATYTIPEVMTIAEAKALENDQYALVQGIVTFIDNRNIYVQDTTAGIDLYLNSNTVPTTLAIGDMVLAYGKKTVYNGLTELTSIDGGNENVFRVISTGNELPAPVVKTIAEILTDEAGDKVLQSSRVQIVEAIIGTINLNGNTAITQGEQSVNIYKIPSVEGLLANDIVTVTSVVARYNGNLQLRVAYASDVTFEHPVVQTVATPTFAPEAGTYYEAQNVTIACTTEGATIYYTLDGTDPTTESAVYTDTIAIAETTTVKAMAAKAGLNNSEIATAVYTITDGPTPITIAEARALANNEYALVQGVVTLIDGRNIYIQDETAGIDLYLNANTVPATLAQGDMVLAYGQKTVFSGLVELKNINGGDTEQFSIVSNGNELPVAVKTIAEILADAADTNMLQSTRIQIAEAIIGAINPSNNTPITQGESTINIYKIPVVEGLQQNDIVTVTGVIGCYNNPQLRIASAADVTFEHPAVQTVSTPTFTPAAGTYYEAQNVTIACTTEGATIYYTLDGTDPTVESTVYAEPIAIAETTTVKAFAVKEGMNDSNIATAVYTIADAPTATDYTLITHNVALVPGDKYLIVGIKNDTLFKALGKQNNNNRAAVDVTPVNNVINVIPAISNEGGVFELTLGQDSVGYWTLYDAVNGGYLYAASSSGNQLKTQATNNANGQWTIDIAGNGVATILAQGSNTRNWMRYNDYNDIFSCYGATSTQLDVYLYKAGEIPQPTYYAVNIAAGIENGTIAVSPEQAYAGATVTVTATPASGYELATLTYTYGTETFDIDQTTMQFVMPEGDVTVNATFAVQETVSTPTFTPAAGSYLTAQDVTILCTTEDASIYYTLDGTDPTTASTAYTEPIAITETTTVKAIAVKEGLNNSEIATAEYVIIEPMTIAEARLLANDEYAMVQGVVTFADNRSIYIQDETAGIVLYLNNNTVPEALTEGDLVQGYGKKTVYKGLVELTGINGGNENEFSIISSGHELPLETVTIADILADFAEENMLQSTRVEIVEATIGTINLNGNTPITQGESTTNIYKIPTIEGLVAGDIVTFAGIIGCYDNPQMRIVSADDVEFYHPGGDPTLTVTPNVLSGFTHVLGEGPSAPQTFVLSGEYLPTGLVTITVDNGFEISYNGNLYTAGEITIPVVNPTLEPTNIYVRLNGQQVGQYNGTIVVAEGDITATLTLSGSVTPGAGLDETLASSVSVWNNVNELMIANDSDKVLNVVVYNMVGQPVLSETIASGNSVIRHDLAEGIYIVRIADGKEMTGIKVVVRR